MASSSSEPPVYECPVCNDFFNKPKLLLCGHILCRDCIVSWLQSNSAALCPLCRDTMVDTQKGQATCYETIADTLADDVAMAAMVESAKFLGRKHVCCIHLDVTAISLCRECNDTFCLTCSVYHKNLPATRHHYVEDLAVLTVEKLATKRQAVCVTHTDKMAEVFCSTHHVPICQVCALLEHRNCPELSDLKRKAELAQGHLDQLLAELTNAHMAMKQTMNRLDHLVLLIDKSTKDEIQDLGKVCSHLHTLVDACQQRLTEAIQNANIKNKSMMAVAKDSLTKCHGKVVSHKLLVERVQQAVSGSELFEMTTMLKARVRDLDLGATTLSNLKSTSLASLVVDPDQLNIVEESLNQLNMTFIPFNIKAGISTPVLHEKKQEKDSSLYQNQRIATEFSTEVASLLNIDKTAEEESSKRFSIPSESQGLSQSHIFQHPYQQPIMAHQEMYSEEVAVVIGDNQSIQPDSNESEMSLPGNVDTDITYAINDEPSMSYVSSVSVKMPIVAPETTVLEMKGNVVSGEVSLVVNGEKAINSPITAPLEEIQFASRITAVPLDTSLIEEIKSTSLIAPVPSVASVIEGTEYVSFITGGPTAASLTESANLVTSLPSATCLTEETKKSAKLVTSVPSAVCLTDPLMTSVLKLSTSPISENPSKVYPGITFNDASSKPASSNPDVSKEPVAAPLPSSNTKDIKKSSMKNSNDFDKLKAPQKKSEVKSLAYSPNISDEKLYRQFMAILNKLTTQKFSTLVQQALTLEINTEERMKGVTDLLFEKALSEPTFSVAYANLCKSMLTLTKVPSSTNPGEFVQFRTILLTKCQREFESDKTAELNLTRREQEIEAAPEGKKAELKEALAEATTKARQRSLGNTVFIGELFKLKMLTENIMHDCLFKLLKSRDDESLECLCRLLTTIGRELETPKAKLRMDQYFQQMNKIKEDMRLISRVRFMIQDVIDLRQNNWVNKPTTIDQIHKEAAQEQVQRQIMLNTPMPKQEQIHGGGHVKGGCGSMSGAGEDGWNTVSTAKAMQTPIDASKMKLSRPNLDRINIPLDPRGGQKFSQWGCGSQSGGSRSQEQDKPPTNRFNLLNNMGDDGRRPVGWSPARGDRRDREGGGYGCGRPGYRGSQESELDRAVASVRSLQPTGSGSSNLSSRNASRDNSRNRERPEIVGRPGGPDALKTTSDQGLQWLESDAETPLSPPPMFSRPTGWVADKLTDRLREKKTDNEKIFDWIESNVSEEEQKSKSFIRELMTAVCHSAISGTTGNAKLLPEMITTRKAILLKYLENRPELELQALFALQALVNKLEHPLGLLRSFFDTLYDEEIISEEAFTAWEETDEQSEGKTISLLNTQQFFVWLHDWEEDS